MAEDEKLTYNTGETTLGDLFGGAAVFDIPYFQRAYKWKPKKLARFEGDLERLLESDAGDLHFFGAIIVHGRRADPAAAKPYQVIDGQQRLTTVYLYLLAAVQALIENDEREVARDYFLAFAVTANNTGTRTNLRLSPSGQDRDELNRVVEHILKLKNFANELVGFQFKPLKTGDLHSSQQIRINYKRCRDFVNRRFAEGGIAGIQSLVATLTQRLTVVQIDIKNTLDGPKIFDSLNSQQEPMSVGELVKNDVFSRSPDGAESTMEALERGMWKPFFEGFPSSQLFDDYFFPFGLFENPTWKKTDVYSQLQRKWAVKKFTPENIIHELQELQPDFIASSTGDCRSEIADSIKPSLGRLNSLKSPSSTYPFVMHVSYAARTNEIPSSTAVGLLSLLEAFLTRRAICGLEPTGLHAVFKGLWQELEGQGDLVLAMESKIRERATVQWPSDNDLKAAVLRRPLYGVRITPFVLREYDLSLGGDPIQEPFEIEHILPQNPASTSTWADDFDSEQRRALTNTLGNLTLVSRSMNAGVSNDDFASKRTRYLDDAKAKATREIGKKYQHWTPDTIAERAQVLADWATARWPDHA